MFHAHQPNSSASDTSCKYMHDLVKCPLKCDLFWLLWTFFIVFLLYLFLLCACVDTDLGVNQREIAEGAEASANHLSWFCNMYSRGKVLSSGNSRLSAWKRTKGRCYLSSHSHTWDMRWHIRLSSAHPYFSGAVVLWQQATEANCVGSSQTGNLHGPPFVCLFWHGCLIFFSCSRAMTWNRSWIRHCRARFFPVIGPNLVITWLKPTFFAPHLCWNTAETLPFCCMLLSFSSFSHNLTLFSPLPLQRDYLWTLSLCCILTVSNS